MNNFPLPDYGYKSVYRSFGGIALEQTLRCPNRCVFCAKARKGHTNVTMSLANLDYVLGLLPDFSGWVSLSGGGDAMLVDDMPERIARIKKAWPRCKPEITTTLTFRREGSFYYDLFASGLDTMVVSCYGHTEEDYEKLHGSPLFHVVKDNLRTMGELPRAMTEKIILRTFRNSREVFGILNAVEKLEMFSEFARQQGIEHFNSINCFPWEQSRTPDGQSLWERPSPCPVIWGAGAAELIIHVDLDVVPCCMMFGKEMVLGNLRTHTLDEIFNGEKYRLFQEKWQQMQPGDIPYCNTCQYYPDSASRDELARMAAWQARELRGRKVIFWGAGGAYRAYKSFFADCEPVAMLLDLPTGGGVITQEIDGIPVYRPEDFLPSLAEPLPLVIFAAKDASPKILLRLKNKFGRYKPSKLVICPANAHIEPQVQPFFPEKA